MGADPRPIYSLVHIHRKRTESVRVSILPYDLTLSLLNQALFHRIVVNGDFRGLCHESATFFASKLLNLRWLGSQQGDARPGGYSIEQRMAKLSRSSPQLNC